MTIDDKIRDEKLRYEINREAAKISVKTLDTPYKYETLTSEKIIHSDQKQLIEQIKFKYGPLGKALEKQTKTFEDQGEKQIKVIQYQRHVKTIKKYAFDDECSPRISKQKEIFNEVADKRLNEITELDKNVNLDDLIYRYKGNTSNEEFNTYDNALDLIVKIKNGEIKLAQSKNNQKKFR